MITDADNDQLDFRKGQVLSWDSSPDDLSNFQCDLQKT